MSAFLFILAGLVLIVAVLTAYASDYAAPDIEQAADVMSERMFLDGRAKQAANANDWDLLEIIDSARDALESMVESQGYTNDDSARWLEGGKEAWEAIRQELEEA